MTFKNFLKQTFFVIFSMGIFLIGNAQQTDELLNILQVELERNMQVFKEKEDPVYLMSYRVDEIQNYAISSTFGNIDNVDYSFSRVRSRKRQEHYAQEKTGSGKSVTSLKFTLNIKL